MRLSQKKTPLGRAVAAVGTQAALAAKIGVTQQTVNHWLRHKKGQVPGNHIVAIERATNGLITRQELRPDLYAPLDLDATA